MRIHDFIGIGVGPFNLGLAALTAPITELDGLFLDRAERFEWHPGMMLETAHLQVPFMADLVTMADPTSPYSFLNYLKSAGRLYPFYIRENFYPLRTEYSRYCAWVAGQLPNVRFGSDVVSVDYDDGARLYRLTVTEGGAQVQYLTRRLVLGTGTSPTVPAHCAALEEQPGSGVVHSGRYLERKAQLQTLESITVVGSGQSAAEIYYDLLQDMDAHGYRLDWVTRSPRFFPLEYTKLTLELTSPEYVDYFHALPADQRETLGKVQKQLYKGINADLINEIYDLLYLRSVESQPRTSLYTNVALENVTPGKSGYELALTHVEQGHAFTLDTAGLVLANGYSYREPAFLAGIGSRIARLPDGKFDVSRDYSVTPGEIFVQNAELHTHGFSAPDLGMGAYRNSVIIREMLGWEYYPIEERIAFQHFGAPVRASDAPQTPIGAAL
ncbi:lysine N6-hydroxylase [Arthrobacter pigmenti]|uniref:L-lysine N6-monooxygenase MbtG n=1 Tax=Arthrobacter pigmenti TaxID=271432 RepID=A0A846RW39_9MICC|nr:lysine N(6)-hydroxylase/L-ornithine N(5)-oxygenase family protein [Arthrobacter pigmenti]NJC24397.1 lysine N6-hydroxylase [Arthrobacter pigmenti]